MATVTNMYCGQASSDIASSRMVIHPGFRDEFSPHMHKCCSNPTVTVRIVYTIVNNNYKHHTFIFKCVLHLLNGVQQKKVCK